MNRLRFTKRPEAVAVHLTCSGRKMGLEGKLRAIAEACAETAVLPPNVGCCGWAGDKGFVTPELTLSTAADGLRTRFTSLEA
jgi:D-lactate dehydrogenase